MSLKQGGLDKQMMLKAKCSGGHAGQHVVQLNKQLSGFAGLSTPSGSFCSPYAHLPLLLPFHPCVSFSSFPFLSIPHSTRLPDGVLFCHCDPLMPSNRAGNILRGFGQG